ncbi:MAG: beta-lactamase family protein [Thermomicrobiales bacterium]|nr:beta-lactamase family protein [Thermomicrobiales bacterium]
MVRTGAIGVVAGIASPWMDGPASARAVQMDVAAPVTAKAAMTMNDYRGFSAERLERMHEVMAGHVESDLFPGLVTLVSRRGETRADAIGTLTFDGNDAMARDTIFRIASITKPIVAVAAMSLVEECVLRLDDPVDPFLPELADRKVLRTRESALDDTVPANRPITLRDLLTMRLGYGAIFAAPGQYPIQQAMEEAGVAPGPHIPDLSADELMQRFGELPLFHQPGEGWLYNSGFDILGVLIARATGQRLGDVLQERIFAPLGMKDTGFTVPAEKLDRLAGSYWTNLATGEFEVFDGIADSRFASPPVFESGAAGLVSTADDLLAFGQMMLGNGEYGGRRILSRPSVALMTTDQITPEQKAISANDFFPGFWASHGWGLGVAIDAQRDLISMTPGRYGWDGGYGTSWYVDPAEELIGILLTQHVWDGSGVLGAFADFWTLTYQALAD